MIALGRDFLFISRPVGRYNRPSTRTAETSVWKRLEQHKDYHYFHLPLMRRNRVTIELYAWYFITTAMVDWLHLLFDDSYYMVLSESKNFSCDKYYAEKPQLDTVKLSHTAEIL